MSDENVARDDRAALGRDRQRRRRLRPRQHQDRVHPRSYGTFARVLGKYVRTDRVLTLEDAVRKMTWSTAQILGLRDRGLVKEGMFADLVLFDPATVSDPATFEQPHQLATGVRDVFVNGVAVWQDGRAYGSEAGTRAPRTGLDGREMSRGPRRSSAISSVGLPRPSTSSPAWPTSGGPSSISR